MRLDPFRLLGKQQHAGQIQLAVVCGQVHVLQQALALVRRLRKLPLIHVAQKVAKAQLVQRLDPGLRWQFIGVELIGNLEQTAQLFFRVHPSLVRAALEPDHPVLIEIRFVETRRNAQHDDNPAGFEHDIFSQHRQWATHQLAGGVADQLIDATDVVGRQAGQSTVIGDTDKDRTAC